ncbi:unnamed protein product, partial [Mesorhabditis belari]|uniref:Transcriptional regulatory protein n=1 Tax=Mesorhabditis belari TaxID=2138241 RepID=A0AAF3E8Y1_9BILA
MWCRLSVLRASRQLLDEAIFHKQKHAIIRSISLSHTDLKGHSHWQNIRSTKEKFDGMRSKAINLLLKKMKVAVKNGYDSKINKELASVESEFLKQGLGMETYTRTLKRLKEKPEVPIDLAVIGPSGTFFVVHMEASSKSTAESTLKKYINKTGGGFRMAPDLSAVQAWFDQKGVLSVSEKDRNNKTLSLEQMEDLGIELDCEEVSAFMEDGERKFELLCNPLSVNKIEALLNEKMLVVESGEVEFRAMHPINVESEDKEKIEKFFKLLEEEDMVINIYDNIDPAS